MTTEYKCVWCNLCYCNARTIYVHVNGKRHKRLMQKYKTRCQELPDVVKFKIISFLYTTICDKMSLHRAIHNYNMEQCGFELYVYSSNSSLCKICKMPRDSLSYESFKKSLSKHEICIDCAFHVLTTSNFLTDMCLYVNENHITLVTEDAYQRLHIFNRFDRVADMLRSIKLFYDRNSFTVPMFDLTHISSFWSVQEYLTYIYYNSLNNINVITLYSSQQI